MKLSIDKCLMHQILMEMEMHQKELYRLLNIILALVNLHQSLKKEQGHNEKLV